MTYSNFEMNRQEGQPATLYFIQWGTASGSYFAYTDSDVAIVHNGITYTPVVIGRADYEASGSLDRKSLEIDITPKCEFVKMYATTPPSVKVGLTIREGHLTDAAADYPVIWTGVIKNVNREPPYAKIVAEPLDSLMAMPGLRRYYMFGCPHVLYDQRTCRANKETHRRNLIPELIGANFVRFAPGWHGSLLPENYIGGYLEWTDSGGNTQIRTAINFGNTEDEIIIGSTANLSPGTTMAFYAGCNRNPTDCTQIYNNIINYGGQEFIPLENPVDFKNRFY